MSALVVLMVPTSPFYKDVLSLRSASPRQRRHTASGSKDSDKDCQGCLLRVCIPGSGNPYVKACASLALCVRTALYLSSYKRLTNESFGARQALPTHIKSVTMIEPVRK